MRRSNKQFASLTATRHCDPTAEVVWYVWGGCEELQTNLEPDVHVKDGGKTGLSPASSIPPGTFSAAQSSIGIPATTLDRDSRPENCLRPAFCLWLRTGNTICITRPVSCLWHSWSYSAWPSTVSIRYSWISYRLDPVIIANRSQTVSFASDVSTESVFTCGVPQGSVLEPILFYIRLMSQTLHCAVVWTFIHMPTIPICTSTVMQWTVQLRQRD